MLAVALAWPILACLAVALLCRPAHAQAAAGLHLATWHSEATYAATEAGRPVQRRYRSVTPGLYIRLHSGLTAGVLRNSYGDPGAYLAWTVESGAAWLPAGTSVALTAGGIAGYRAEPVLPLLAPSVRVSLARSVGLRLTALPAAPKAGHAVHAVHISLEWRP